MAKLRIERQTNRITAAVLTASLKNREGRRLSIKDEGTAGLSLVINPTTARWRYSWRPVGVDPKTGKRPNEITVTLGPVDAMSPKEARILAAEAHALVKRGGDPRDIYSPPCVAAPAAPGCEDLADLTSRYIARIRRRGISGKWVLEQRRYLDRMLEAMRVTNIDEISRSAVFRGLDAMDPRRPRTAMALGTFQRFCDFLVEEEIIANNPTRNLPKSRRPARARDRSRFLSEVELCDLLHAARTLDDQRRLVVELLVAMPVRISAIERVRWSHVDLIGRTWSFPEALTKNGDCLTLYLNDRAVSVFAAIGRGQPDEIVFRNSSGSGFNAWSWLKRAVIQAGFNAEDWGWHDLRRTFVSLMAERDLADEGILDAALNHRQSATRGGVRGIYNRARRWQAHVSAMQAWSRLLDEIEAGEYGNLVAMG
jgi:integrase